VASPLAKRWQVPGRQLGLLLPPVWRKSWQQRVALRAWLREPRALALPEPLAWVAQPQVPPDAS